MSRRPLSVWALTVLLVGVSVALSVGRDHPSDLVFYTLLPLTVATVGALIVHRHPQHQVGRILVAFAVYESLIQVTQGYGLLAEDVGLAGADVCTWVSAWAWTPEVGVWAVVAAVFPNGHLLSRGWRWVPWAAAAGCALTAAGMAFSPVQANYFASGVNPFLVEGRLPYAALLVGAAVAVTALLGGVTALVVRLRRSRGVERQQLRLFALAASVVAGFGPVALVISTLLPRTSDLMEVVAFNGLPIAAAVGVAILRHRLYDIDVVITRTVVYSVLTLALVGTYVVLVLVLQVLLRPVAGSSDLAVAASTLAVAALFRPLRSTIQGVVDRRFYRSRYDAARTLDTFAADLRHQLDLDSLGTDLRDVVRETMQPQHVTLWLRADRERRNDSRTTTG